MLSGHECETDGRTAVTHSNGLTRTASLCISNTTSSQSTVRNSSRPPRQSSFLEKTQITQREICKLQHSGSWTVESVTFCSWDTIEAGEEVAWRAKVQVMQPDEADFEKLGFDPFDVTKVWPRGQFPVRNHLSHWIFPANNSDA